MDTPQNQTAPSSSLYHEAEKLIEQALANMGSDTHIEYGPANAMTNRENEKKHNRLLNRIRKLYKKRRRQ